jgi:putative addiction module component (TIGR02574 family)
MTVAQLKQQALALKPSQRLRLAQDIWESVVKEPQSIQVPVSHLQIIEERLVRSRSHPNETITYAEAKKQISRRLARKPKK